MARRAIPFCLCLAVLLIGVDAIARASSASPLALVSGRVVLPAAASSESRSILWFVQSGQRVATTMTNQSGVWQISLAPGEYDVEISVRGAFAEIKNVSLHAGEQSFGDIQTQYRTIDMANIDPVTVIRRPWAYRL